MCEYEKLEALFLKLNENWNGSYSNVHVLYKTPELRFSVTFCFSRPTQTDATSHNIVACCCGFEANNVASACMYLKVWSVSNYMQQVPRLKAHPNGRNIVGQQHAILLGPNAASVCMEPQQCWHLLRIVLNQSNFGATSPNISIVLWPAKRCARLNGTMKTPAQLHGCALALQSFL